MLIFLLTACPGTVRPSAPSGVTATPELSVIDVHWQDDSDNEQGFVIFRASGESDFVQLAEVGPNVTSYQDTALEADVVYRYAVAAKGSAQNSAQTIQAEAGASVSYHGEAVRSFTGEVTNYSAGQARLTAVNALELFASTLLGTGNVSAEGALTFAYNATVAALDLSSSTLCGNDPPESAVKLAFSPALLAGNSSEPAGRIYLASSQAAAERALPGPGQVGDVVAVWWYVAKDISYKASRKACGANTDYSLELKAGWNTVVYEVTDRVPTTERVLGTITTGLPPAELNWYFVGVPKNLLLEPPVNASPADLFGLSGK